MALLLHVHGKGGNFYGARAPLDGFRAFHQGFVAADGANPLYGGAETLVPDTVVDFALDVAVSSEQAGGIRRSPGWQSG